MSNVSYEDFKGITKDEAKAETEKLTKLFQENAAAFQAASQAANASTQSQSSDSAAGSAPKKDDVVDADFEVVDDEKKDENK